MPKITLAKTQQIIEVPMGANLMFSLLQHQIPVASSCDGDGVCAKCRIRIAHGAENLSSQNEIEIFLRERHQIYKDQRIACQTFIHGDVTVDASYW